MSPKALKSISIAAISAAMAFTLSGCSAGDTTAETPAQAAETSVADGDMLRGQTLALTCSGCHAGAGDAIPDYYALDRATLEVRLLTYKTEEDGTTVMHRLMRGYGEADIAAVAAYLTAPGEG
ncbi:c-type cytochrome [Henriciella marina]|uniref:Cytochrome c domain-containing protein n=1 Tax=Henriciella marina TaxID=453851 RepID=A0ABT4LQ55_9PROT|nr:hypothetical protein [Henriciella marina]MCZ4296500.1 hypothetical protein [Henriciella marina]